MFLQGLATGVLDSSRVHYTAGVTEKPEKKTVNHSVRWHSDVFHSLGISIFGKVLR